jgi:hypothetical protein
MKNAGGPVVTECTVVVEPSADKPFQALVIAACPKTRAVTSSRRRAKTVPG